MYSEMLSCGITLQTSEGTMCRSAESAMRDSPHQHVTLGLSIQPESKRQPVIQPSASVMTPTHHHRTLSPTSVSTPTYLFREEAVQEPFARFPCRSLSRKGASEEYNVVHGMWNCRLDKLLHNALLQSLRKKICTTSTIAFPTSATPSAGSGKGISTNRFNMHPEMRVRRNA